MFLGWVLKRTSVWLVKSSYSLLIYLLFWVLQFLMLVCRCVTVIGAKYRFMCWEWLLIYFIGWLGVVVILYLLFNFRPRKLGKINFGATKILFFTNCHLVRGQLREIVVYIDVTLAATILAQILIYWPILEIISTLLTLFIYLN